MVHVRLGTTWRQDPTLRSALSRGGLEARLAVTQAVDALALEVDGIDIAGGRAEGALLQAVSSLGEALLSLAAGAGRSEVHFPDGGVDLVLERRGESALLTLVSLHRPARVLAREVDVELSDLARAAAAAAGRMADDVEALRVPGLEEEGRRLRRLAARLISARPERGEPAASALRHAGGAPAADGAPLAPAPVDAPSCTFELDEDAVLLSYVGPGADLGSLLVGGKVILAGSGGHPLVVLEGPPFLALRELSAFAERLADAARRGDASAVADLARPGRRATVRLRADLGAGSIDVDGGAPCACPPLLLARAVLAAALELCSVVCARNPLQASNGWLVDLRADATERLAHVEELLAGDVVGAGGLSIAARRPRPLPRAPLGPGSLRRVLYRVAWRADVGAPAGFGVLWRGGLVIAAGSGAVTGLEPDGRERWRRGGADGAWAGKEALFLSDASALACVDAASGRERWVRRADELPERARDVVELGGGLVAVAGPRAVAALDAASGATLWTFAPPAARGLRPAALGPVLVLGGDAGFLYGLASATGRVVWRLRLPGPLTGPACLDRETCLALCATDLGGSLVGLDPATGRRRFETPFDVTPAGNPVAFAGLLAVAGAIAGDPVVAAFDAAGRLSWEDAPPLGRGALVVASTRAGLLAKTATGACAALARDGSVTWSRAASALQPPAANVPPIVARGVVLLPSEEVRVLDATDGRVIGDVGLVAPVRLAVDARLDAWGLDADGIVTAARLETHLSLV